jgi:hypothetical protein
VKERYRQTAQFGDDCVWLRNDLAMGLPEVARVHVRLGEL